MAIPRSIDGVASNTLRALRDESQDCITILSAEGQLEFMNAHGLEALAIGDFATVAGREWGALWPEMTRPLVDAAVTRARAGQATRFQGFCPSAAGERRWWDVSVSPIRDDEGVVRQIVANLRDVSYQYTEAGREEALRAMVRQLTEERERLVKARAEMNHAEKLRLLGQFAGSIVHDLNNVLAVLQSASSILRRRVESDLAVDVLDHVDEAILRGSQLTRQLLDFSRVDAGVAEVIDLRELVERDADLLRHLLGKEIALTCESDDQPPLVLAPSSRVRSVLFNLVANCRDAIRERGAVAVRIRTRTLYGRVGDLAAGRYAVLEIRDNGSGMPPEVLSRLGEAFFTTKAGGKGTGLGIPSAFELARMCAGAVEIESEVGEGTVVRVLMSASPARGRTFAGRGGQFDPGLHGNATILVVENDELLRQHLVSALRSLGYAVLEAPGATSAIATAIAATRIDILISDLQLDDMDGHDVAAVLRARLPDLPIIFLSGTAGRGFPAGEILLRKPVDEDVLGQVVLEQLGRLPARHLTDRLLGQSERLKGRLTQPGMIAAYELWRANCLTERRLPAPEMLAAIDPVLRASGYVVEVAGTFDLPTFRFVTAAPQLEARLNRPLVATYVTSADEDALGSLGRAMARAMRGVAFYDYARFRAGDVRVLFERLLLPLSENGIDVTHLLGIVTFDEQAD